VRARHPNEFFVALAAEQLESPQEDVKTSRKIPDAMGTAAWGAAAAQAVEVADGKEDTVPRCATSCSG
jgi:hypothetical protein